MKERFTNLDVVCAITELKKLIGMRVNSIYDIDNKTYLIKLQKPDHKEILLFESGRRIHTTHFEWPKNVAPSGFSMKLRKHLRNKRLENINQIGIDRIIDMQFGINEAAYHIILELYDRGNIVLADYQYMIVAILRPFVEGEEVKFVVREKYPLHRAKENQSFDSMIEVVQNVLMNAKQNDSLKAKLVPILPYGPALVEHSLLKFGFPINSKIGVNFIFEKDFENLKVALHEADQIMNKARSEVFKGYIVKKKEERPCDSEQKELCLYLEFHSFVFHQLNGKTYNEYDTFLTAVDEFFSTIEGQKIDLKTLNQEKEAYKKLENVRKDHHQRLQALEETQELDKVKAELITRNYQLVDNVIFAIQSALANQLSWLEIESQLKEAQERGDQMSQSIKSLKLNTNHVTLFLTDNAVESEESEHENSNVLPSMLVDIDLGLTSFANARKYYDLKRNAAKKQQKTIASQTKALKSAERKTKQTLKEVQTTANINKARKVFWFEKFFWFISSENYLIIGGRDQIQNETLVKRYMKSHDIYVHADIHGASSVVIKNPSNTIIPPKTLNEAGTMAICYSVAWEANVITNAWWVNSDQVSKVAPSGEYLPTGSFMIRGKKNFLPPSQLSMGFAFLFKLDDGSIERHCDERKFRQLDEQLAVNEFQEIPDDNDSEDSELNDNAVDDQVDSYADIHVNLAPFKSLEPVTEIDTLVTNLKNTTVSKKGKKVRISEEVKILDKNERLELKQTQEMLQSSEQKQPKRRQKSKMKKIKEKYKDQDEDERILRMKLLQPDGPPRPKKTKKDKSKKNQLNKSKPEQFVNRNIQIHCPDNDNNDNDNDDDDNQIVTDVDMIDSLTGIPVLEDELLFAIPVVAPYNTLLNYKYKVKLTPGTIKRGKAARTAATMFMNDKLTTQREKDLIRSVKDEVLTRNLPAKVKIFAQKLQSRK